MGAGWWGAQWLKLYLDQPPILRLDCQRGTGMTVRKRPTSSIETAVLVASHRKCCLCYYWDEIKGRCKGQIAHINGKAHDSRFDNLVFLCIDHHDEYDSRTSQSKGITSGELRVFRNRLYKELNSKSSILNNSADAVASETSSFDESTDYEKVRKHFADELDFTLEPWRYALWQTANEPEFFAYKAPNRADGVCLIERINLPDGRIVIVCVQTDGNPGNSITNCVETLCFQVCERFEIDPSKLIWLEHYSYGNAMPPEDWRMVTFSGYPPKKPFEGPIWTTMTSEMWRSLMLRPKKAPAIRYGQIQSKVRKLFHWPTGAIVDP
jgi:hypothetical protein